MVYPQEIPTSSACMYPTLFHSSHKRILSNSSSVRVCLNFPLISGMVFHHMEGSTHDLTSAIEGSFSCSQSLFLPQMPLQCTLRLKGIHGAEERPGTGISRTQRIHALVSVYKNPNSLLTKLCQWVKNSRHEISAFKYLSVVLSDCHVISFPLLIYFYFHLGSPRFFYCSLFLHNILSFFFWVVTIDLCTLHIYNIFGTYYILLYRFNISVDVRIVIFFLSVVYFLTLWCPLYRVIVYGFSFIHLFPLRFLNFVSRLRSFAHRNVIAILQKCSYL